MKENKDSTTPAEFMRWAMINKWRISTKSRQEVTEKARQLFSDDLITSEQLETYLNLHKRDF